ncbi:MAG: hypothetical protein H6Q89_293, partial [Myxococcaceae bacterium]|nr:hypothetical protein [Myxococcaceae bacterium]
MPVLKIPWVAAFLLLASCAHRELTGEEHREAAAADLEVAEQER